MFHLPKVLSISRLPSPVHYSLHRALLLSTAAAGASPVPFAAEDYLVTTCGLPREQAASVAKHIAHCKSPSKANAVISFLASPAVGLSSSEIARIVSYDARILNSSVEKTLRPRVDAFLNHGFTATQIRTFINSAPCHFHRFNADKKLGFWIPLLGSPEKFLLFLKCNYYIITSNLEGVVKVNMQLLREFGLSDADAAKTCLTNRSWLLTSNPDKIRATITRAEELGVPRDSLMFRQVVTRVSILGPETLAAKLKFISEMLGCSVADVAKVLKNAPALLSHSTERLHRVSEFLTKVVGIDGKNILGNPVLLMFSLERRIAPRHYVMKVLLEKGLMRKKTKFCTLMKATEKEFQSRYIIPHMDVLPGLADTYASACKGGKLPT